MDLRYAIRGFSRQPWFTAGAIATLALGIGVNSTIFTLANAALFRAMPGIADPGRLVWISSTAQGRDVRLSYPDFFDYTEGTRDLIDAFAFQPVPLSMGTGEEPQRIRGHLVTGRYFDALGIRPAHGRLLDQADERPDGPHAVVVSHLLWQRLFRGSPEAIRRTLTLNGSTFDVVGVAPEHFAGPALGEAADVWLSVAVAPVLRSADRDLLERRDAGWLLMMGRLRPGVSARSMEAAARTVAARIEQAYPNPDTPRGVSIRPADSGLPPAQHGELLPLSALLLAATAIVLLIACANVANLLLARGASRTLELSIRAAIGATRRRLVRQLFVEHAVLGVAGAAAGLLMSFWATDLIAVRLPDAEFRGLDARADGRVLLFTAAAAVLSTLIFGVIPALSATRGTLQPRLRETPGAGGRSRLQGGFVVAQLGLSVVLLLAAGLTLQALGKTSRIDLGFEPSGVVTASYDLVLQNYDAARRAAFRAEARRRLAALPGVEEVGIANVPPLSGIMVRTVVTGADGSAEGREVPTFLTGVGPGYFEALKLPVLTGRSIDARDTRGAERVVVVNETFARRLWDVEDAVNRAIRIDDVVFRVAGVARDAKYDEPAEAPQPFVYTAIDQLSHLDREAVILRAGVAPASLIPAVKEAIRALDPALPIFDVRTFADVLKARADTERGVTLMLGVSGAAALLLAALGLYAVMSCAVARRTREIGIRLALGARPADVSARITAEGTALALTGIAAGSAIALPLAWVSGVFAPGVQPGDVAAVAVVCLLLVAVAALASLLPARRAARLDPLGALRAE